MGLRTFLSSRSNRKIQAAANEAAEQAYRKGMADGLERLSDQLLTEQDKKAVPRMYGLGNPGRYIMPANPGHKVDALFDDRMMREISMTCDPLRSCIEQIKREVATTHIKIRVRTGMKVQDSDLMTARAFFENEGGCGGHGKDRIDFEKELIEDILSIGCCAIGVEYTRGGQLFQAFAVDASTIRVAIDSYGFEHPTQPFEQWISGFKTGVFDASQLIYRGVIPLSSSPYFKAPIEVAIRPIQRFLQVDDWNSSYFKIPLDPEIYETFPESWDASQIAAYLKAIEETTVNDPVTKRKARIVPPGTQIYRRDRKDQDFSDYEPRIVKRICSVMGVQPASIGYEGEMYKVAQDAAHQQTSTFGVGAILQLRKAIYDRLLVLGGWPELEVVDVGQEKESQGDRAKRLVTATGGPYMTLNEGRAEEGKDPIPGGDTIRLAAVGGGSGVGRAGSAALLDTALTGDALCSDACDCGRCGASLTLDGSAARDADFPLDAHQNVRRAGASLPNNPSDGGRRGAGSVTAGGSSSANSFEGDRRGAGATLTSGGSSSVDSYEDSRRGAGATLTAGGSSSVDSYEGDQRGAGATLTAGGSSSADSFEGDQRGGVGASERADAAGDDSDSFAELAEAHFMARADDLARWERKAIKRLKDKQSPACDFQSEFLSDEERSQILAALGGCGTVEAIREAFGMVRG